MNNVFVHVGVGKSVALLHSLEYISKATILRQILYLANALTCMQGLIRTTVPFLFYRASYM